MTVKELLSVIPSDELIELLEPLYLKPSNLIAFDENRYVQTYAKEYMEREVKVAFPSCKKAYNTLDKLALCVVIK